MMTREELAESLDVDVENVLLGPVDETGVCAIVLGDCNPERMGNTVHKLHALGCSNFLANVVDARFAKLLRGVYVDAGFDKALEQSWDYVIATVRG